MKMKKWLSFLLAAVLAALCLAGCGGNQNSAVVEEDMNQCPEDSYEINWYLMAEPQSDVHSIEAALNDYLKDKINVTVKINCLSSAQYGQKMNTMINANEYFDLCFAARWMLDYVNNARAGAFVALDDYLDSYLKDTAAGYNEGILDCSRVDGTLYALPVNKEMATQYGWIYRKDIADKYNIDMSQYKSFEDLEPVLAMIKENEPEMNYPIDWSIDTAPFTLYQSENFIFKDGTYPDDTVMNIFGTPEFKQACETARDFYEKGYVRSDVLTATDQLQRMKEGKTFVMLQPIKPGKVQELFKDSTYQFAQTGVTQPMIDYLAGTGSMQAISATSKNPVRVARFLNILNTDPYVKNLVIHGIEGKHYTKIDEKTVEPIENSGYDLYADSWTIGNVFLDYLTTAEEPDKLEQLKQFNAEAKDSRVNKFLLEANDDVEQRQAEISNVIDKYKKQLVVGAVDPETTIPEFLEQLDVVGVQEQIQYNQEQYDAYLKTLEQ
ncbi:ABC transporter substrate-binding protein [Ructibacterium gallinarum]|uniref:ABC transporter substrate-binding protein n=1 Tax=Ructibacterium gallinarum TaxID=2779355 RepID=A0A9D5R867_9FIRM|nr:ABC transporter substrate-binding protein [Ructibacterium gallinarum]MBE5039159.1 ABC transporter substrate-binding protein [Ructibacterium gallinarum]